MSESASKRLDVARRDDALRRLRDAVTAVGDPVARQTLIVDQGLTWIHDIVTEAARSAVVSQLGWAAINAMSVEARQQADDAAVVAQIDKLLAR